MATADLVIESVTAESVSLGSFRVQAGVTVSESDTNLKQWVYGVIDWGDGTIENVNVGPTNLIQSTAYYIYQPELQGSVYHDYSTSGRFNIVLTGYNLRFPTHDSVKVYESITLTSGVTKVAPTPTLIGPILPLDSGFPTAAQWVLNTGVDLSVLASNVKMILITNVGERVMIPSYGSNLRALLFSPNDTATQVNVSTEISRALQAWEPRVKVSDLQVSGVGTTNVNVSLSLVSILSSQPFMVSLNLTQ